MILYIPTYRRVDQQTTWEYLKDCTPSPMLVCPADEAHQHLSLGRTTLISPVEGRVHLKRQWLVDQSPDDLIIMADDDLRFLRRKQVGDWHLRPANTDDLNDMFWQIRGLLDHYPLVGVSARQGNNNMSGEVEFNSRICTCYAINRRILREHNIRFDVQPLMEDFHINLSLLEKGYETAVITEFAWDQRQSNAPGGCSEERGDGSGHTAAANRLAQLHPQFVKVVTKERKASWKGLEVRQDVNVQWKKAYTWGLENA